MTDGPFRHLPLSGCWKKTADALAKEAWSAPDVAHLSNKAVFQDIKQQGGFELVKDIQAVLPKQNDLLSQLGSDAADCLRALRNKHPQSSFNVSLMRHMDFYASQGEWNSSGLERAIQCAVDQHKDAGLDAIITHGIKKRHELDVGLRTFLNKCREARNFKTDYVTTRLVSGMSARYLIPKKSGLDDGVPF